MNERIFNTSYKAKLWENARVFLKKYAVSTGKTFTLKSGRKSDFYVDCRVAALIGDDQLTYEHSTDLSRMIQYCIDCIGFDAAALAPVPLGGLLLLLRTRQSLPAIIPRIGQKEHGRKLKVEGLYDASGNRLLPKESNVVLIEDVITTGGTTIAAAETLREENLNPSGVMVLVDREEGGREAIEKEGIQVQSIFTQSDLR